jgi:hypothetical protein
MNKILIAIFAFAAFAVLSVRVVTTWIAVGTLLQTVDIFIVLGLPSRFLPWIADAHAAWAAAVHLPTWEATTLLVATSVAKLMAKTVRLSVPDRELICGSLR